MQGLSLSDGWGVDCAVLCLKGEHQMWLKILRDLCL